MTIQADEIYGLVEIDSPEAAALKTLIRCRFFERLIDKDRINVMRDWRGTVPEDRVKMLDAHAVLQTTCESFISLGEMIRNEGEANG